MSRTSKSSVRTVKGHGGWSCAGAFTLVELLVVIGIIALLISILLPGLQAARRQANQVKCLAALHDIGHAFQLYAVDSKGYFPAARYHVGASSQWHRWTDLIAKYMTKRPLNNYQDVAELRRNSTLWGCPEWTRAYDWSPSTNPGSAVNVYNGYGMQYYPSFYEDGGQAKYLANKSSASSPALGHIRASYWGRKGSERGLIADSQWDIIYVNGTTPITRAMLKFEPFFAHGYNAVNITIDARHLKPGTSHGAALGAKGANMLFCDGHAAQVTPVEAYNAIHNPGRDTVRP